MRLVWHGDRVRKTLHERAERAARLGAERLLETSNSRVPNDPKTHGTDLQDSGQVTVDGTTAAVSYGTPYAIAQHEALSWEHRPGQQAKFLESAMADDAEQVRAIIHRALKL
jgi:hypothetical protein